MPSRAWEILRFSRAGKLDPGEAAPQEHSQEGKQMLVASPPVPSPASLPPLVPFPHSPNTGSHQHQHSWPSEMMPNGRLNLSQKEKELARREMEVQRRERLYFMPMWHKKSLNWPRCHPLVYHDIDMDIPEPLKGFMKLAYTTWCMTVVGFFLNWLLVSILFLTKLQSVDMVDWCIATFATGSGIPMSFKLWYQRLYKSARDGDRLGSTGFFLHGSFALLWAAWVIVSMPVFGDMAAGLFPLLQAFKDNNTLLGLACFLNMVVWALSSLFLLAIFNGTRRLEKVQSELGTPGNKSLYKSGISASNQLRFPFTAASLFNKQSIPSVPSAPPAPQHPMSPQACGYSGSVLTPVTSGHNI